VNRIILLPEDKLENDFYQLTNVDRLDHILNHLKANVGDQFKVCILNQGIGQGRVEEIKKDAISFSVSKLEKPKALPFHLICALSRPPTMKKVLEHGTSLGVKKFSFFNAELSQKSYADSKVLQRTQLNDLLMNGLSQEASTCELPSVNIYDRLDLVPMDKEEVDSKSQQRYLLSLDSHASPLSNNLDFDKEIVFAIGPERGWTAAEEDFLKGKNFRLTKISLNTLRVEIALFAFLGQLHHNHITTK
tara:strand:+ start:17580 stop:18320 length:741 start_codon:yes stop_codon:yes gene_type:complete